MQIEVWPLPPDPDFGSVQVPSQKVEAEGLLGNQDVDSPGRPGVPSYTLIRPGVSYLSSKFPHRADLSGVHSEKSCLLVEALAWE